MLYYKRRFSSLRLSVLISPRAINQFVKENNGFKYAENLMSEYKNKALKILETFPDNESKNSLKILLDYIIDRKY